MSALLTPRWRQVISFDEGVRGPPSSAGSVHRFTSKIHPQIWPYPGAVWAVCWRKGRTRISGNPPRDPPGPPPPGASLPPPRLPWPQRSPHLEDTPRSTHPIPGVWHLSLHLLQRRGTFPVWLQSGVSEPVLPHTPSYGEGHRQAQHWPWLGPAGSAPTNRPPAAGSSREEIMAHGGWGCLHQGHRERGGSVGGRALSPLRCYSLRSSLCGTLSLQSN